MKYECSLCGRCYDNRGLPPMTAPPTCSTVAAKFAIECCKVEYPNAHHYKENV